MLRYLTLLCLTLGLAAAIPDCRLATPAEAAPDLFSRCVKENSCTYCSRNQWSLDFLCCEDGGGWVAAHVVTPFVIHFYWQNTAWTIAAIVLWEVFETLMLTSISMFGLFPTNDIDFETAAGALVGDVLNGFIGLWLCTMLLYIADFPLLVSTRWHARNYRKKNRRARYIFVWALHTAVALVIGYSASNDTIRYGLYINTFLQLLLFWVLHPWALYTAAENEMIWRSRIDRTLYPRRWQLAVFYGAGGIVLAIHLATIGFSYFANDWFQVWLTAAIVGTGLTVAASYVAAQRRDLYMLVVFLAAFVLAASLAVLLVGKLYDSVAIYFGLVLLIAAVLALVLNALLQSRAAPWKRNYSRRHPKDRQTLADLKFTQ